MARFEAATGAGVRASRRRAVGRLRARPGRPSAGGGGPVDVPVLTSPGLSLLLAAARDADAGGRLVITGLEAGRDLLRRCRLDAVLNIVPDADEAIRKARE